MDAEVYLHLTDVLFTPLLGTDLLLPCYSRDICFADQLHSSHSIIAVRVKKTSDQLNVVTKSVRRNRASSYASRTQEVLSNFIEGSLKTFLLLSDPSGQEILRKSCYFLLFISEETRYRFRLLQNGISESLRGSRHECRESGALV